MPSKNRSNHRLHRSSKNAEDETTYGKDEYSRMGPENLICCMHGIPCQLKENQKRRSNRDPRMPVLEAPLPMLAISPSAPNSPYTPARILSSEETGYENLNALNGQTTSVPALVSSAGSDDNKFDYSLVSDDTKACYEPIAKEPIIEDLVRPKPVSAVNRVVKSQEDLHKTIYLGEMSRSMAEAACIKNASFLLYNRFPSSRSHHASKHMPPHLPLFIVYRTSNGEHCHYRIVDKDTMGSKSPSQASAAYRQHHLNEYRVDIPGEPYFSCLKALVSYYLTYVMVNREGITDIFPWWRTKNEYLNRADIYADSK